MFKFQEAVQKNPVIAAVREMSLLPAALKSRACAIFVLCGDICTIADAVAAAKKAHKPIFLHLDLLEGLGRDKAAIKFLAREIGPDGIITTRSHLIKYAQKYGLFTVQRVFVLDSLSLKTGISNVKSTGPDAVECLPGILPTVIARFVKEVNLPVIAGGLIRSREEIRASLSVGAVAVSLSAQELW